LPTTRETSILKSYRYRSKTIIERPNFGLNKQTHSLIYMNKYIANDDINLCKRKTEFSRGPEGGEGQGKDIEIGRGRGGMKQGCEFFRSL